jgi:hypothetical protein
VPQPVVIAELLTDKREETVVAVIDRLAVPAGDRVAMQNGDIVEGNGFHGRERFSRSEDGSGGCKF